MQQYLEAGKVVTTHGVRGEMKLELWCDGVNFLKKVGRLYASAQGGRAWKIVSIRAQGQMALLQLEGVNDMDAARALRGQVFYFDRNDATLPAGRWYVADLIGCEVRDADTGRVYGVVTSVDHPGAQDDKIVAAHLGGWKLWDDVEKYLVGTPIYFDTAFTLNFITDEQLLRIIKNHGSEKILHATDSPWEKQGQMAKHLSALPLSEEDCNNIFYKNAKKLLKIG